MGDPGQRPTAGQRLAAIAAIVLFVIVVVDTVITITTNPLRVLLQFVLLGIAAFALWHVVSREGLHRLVALVIAVVALVGTVLAGRLDEDASLWSLVVRAVLLVLAVGCVRFAISTTVKQLKQQSTPGTEVPPASRGVLIMNLKSGGGKAERFHLEDECHARGIEPVVLGPDDDLLQLAHDAADRGADVLGMAGGDGSQALVASVAAERGLPMVVIPAGTRNHLALDLGLDREDVVGALDAFGAAREQRMDLADVNGHVFVNNVSLGLYATIVRSPEYRDAKMETTMSTLPTVLAPGTAPFDLRFTGPDGEPRTGAHVIQVSNNPYGSTVVGMGSRPRLDTHRLGILMLEIRDDAAVASLLGAVATGHPERFDGLRSWSAPRFEVSSGSPIAVGLDGETMQMDPPLVFSIRPDPLRVRLPEHAIGYSPAALSTGWRSKLLGVWRVALGHPAQIGVGQRP